MKIGFETFDHRNPTFKQMVMSMASKGIFYHCEIHFKDGSVGYAGNKGRGVVLISNQDNIYKSEDWLFYEIPCTEEEEQKAQAYFVNNLNKKYNYAGVLGSMISGLNITSRKGEFCSQICYNALLSSGIIKDFGFKPAELSPSDLQEIIQKLGWKETTYSER